MEMKSFIDMKTKVLIVVPNYWGKGDTITEAWNQVNKESGRGLRHLKSNPFQIYVVHDTDEQHTYLDEFGFNFHHPEGYPPRLIEKRDA